jgi:hypothetical protein
MTMCDRKLQKGVTTALLGRKNKISKNHQAMESILFWKYAKFEAAMIC